MKKVAIVLSYFGTPKPFFKAFLASAEKNETIDFYFCGMNPDLIGDHPNFHYIRLNLQSFKNLIERFAKIKNICISPYKTSEYRPAIGLIFQDFLKSYDYWGVCDPDVVLGDIRTFLGPIFESGYERILELGHLCFYKNAPDVNRFFLREQNGQYTGYSFDFISHSPLTLHFDEMCGVNPLWASFKSFQWYRNNHIFSDLKSDYLDMRNWHYRFRHRVFYEYIDGKLFEYLIVGKKHYRKEMLYVHFQKRKIEMSDFKNKDHFYFFNNAFSSSASLNECFTNIFFLKRLIRLVKVFVWKCNIHLIYLAQRFFRFTKKRRKMPIITGFEQLPPFSFEEYLSDL